MPHWIKTGFTEYQKRLNAPWRLELIELPPEKNKAAEAESLLSKVQAQDGCIALDPKGKSLTTEVFAAKLSQWQQSHQHLCFLIGGHEGLDQRCLDRAEAVIALSAFTFPHQLVKVIMAEQLYRAVSLLNHHPYHRA